MANKFDIRDGKITEKTKTPIGYKKGPICEVYPKKMSLPKRTFTPIVTVPSLLGLNHNKNIFYYIYA